MEWGMEMKINVCCLCLACLGRSGVIDECGQTKVKQPPAGTETDMTDRRAYWAEDGMAYRN